MRYTKTLVLLLLACHEASLSVTADNATNNEYTNLVETEAEAETHPGFTDIPVTAPWFDDDADTTEVSGVDATVSPEILMLESILRTDLPESEATTDSPSPETTFSSNSSEETTTAKAGWSFPSLSLGSSNRTRKRANCTPAAVDELPADFATQHQRFFGGGIIVHILVALYLVAALGVACDGYFVPVLEHICQTFKIKPDVAGATIMTVATTAPELCSNLIGTFVTKNDLGIGTVVGSAVFKIAVIAICGLTAGFTHGLRGIKLEWYPITRDTLCYGVTLLMLIGFLLDEKIYWYESFTLVLTYVAYILMMYFNENVEGFFLRLQASFVKCRNANVVVPHEEIDKEGRKYNESKLSFSLTSGNSPIQNPWLVPRVVRDEKANVVKRLAIAFAWITLLPINMLFFITIPDVRRGPKYSRFFLFSFLMSMAWIGGISYILVWMITVIGFTFGIPDSVMGLSFLGIGNSVPEVFACVCIARRGFGSMALSNSLGSNTFNVLICLGVPWLLEAIVLGASTPNDPWFVQVDSDGLAYTVIAILACLAVFFFILILTRFRLGLLVGISCGLIYIAFITVSILFNMNVFFPVILPTCHSNY